MKNQSQTLFQKDLVNEAIRQSFVKLNPKIMFKNPVMFLVEIGTAVMLIVSLFSLTPEEYFLRISFKRIRLLKI